MLGGPSTRRSAIESGSAWTIVHREPLSVGTQQPCRSRPTVLTTLLQSCAGRHWLLSDQFPCLRWVVLIINLLLLLAMPVLASRWHPAFRCSYRN